MSEGLAQPSHAFPYKLASFIIKCSIIFLHVSLNFDHLFIFLCINYETFSWHFINFSCIAQILPHFVSMVLYFG